MRYALTRWDSFTLKPQLSNIVRGRFRFIKDQVAYKLGALLETRIGMPHEIEEYLFGDDAEADAFIYSIYSDLCAGRVDNEVLMEVLRRAGVYEDALPKLVRLASRLPRHDGGRRIFIHLDRVSSPDFFDEFGRRVCPFYNYLQPAFVLLAEGALGPASVIRVAAELVIHHAFTAAALVASFVDLVERGHLSVRAAAPVVATIGGLEESHFATTYPVLRAFADQLDAVAEDLTDPPAEEDREIDYVALFARDKARARRAKERLVRG